MPNLAKSKAWNMLKEEEQLALNLKLIQKKSTWEAGEIMKRSHYKYLEIASRAQYFLKKFTEHFDKYGDLIPEDVELNTGFKKYLELVILKRYQQKEAFNELSNYRFSYDSAFRTEFMATELNRLKDSNKLIEKYFYNLIMDFDRWNNFRILPLPLQEPHAFKRRQKNRLKKFLHRSCYLGDQVYKFILKELRYKKNDEHTVWAYAIKNIDLQEYQVIPIKNTERNIKTLSQYGIFIFRKKEQAEEMLSTIAGYFRITNTSNVLKGQSFWPIYRDLIKISINGNYIENIIPSRKEHIVFIENPVNELKKVRKLRAARK